MREIELGKNDIEAMIDEFSTFANTLEHDQACVDWDVKSIGEIINGSEALYRLAETYVRFEDFCNRANKFKPAEHLHDFVFKAPQGFEELREHQKQLASMSQNEKLARPDFVSKFSLGIRDLFNRLNNARKNLDIAQARKTLEHWKDLWQVYCALEILTHDYEGANEIAGRSYANMRNLIERYLQTIKRNNPSLDIKDVILQIQEQLELEGHRLSFGYYERADDAREICSSKNIMVLHEHTEDQQRFRAKSPDGARLTIGKRKEIEQALGHQGERVIHMTVDSSQDEHYRGGAMENYGPVRFGFDSERIQGATTFTIGDSLNARAVRDIFATGLEGTGGEYERARSSAQQRQIIFAHIPLAKAIMHLSLAGNDETEALYYIEAQIDDSDHSIFDGLSEISVQKDQDEVLREEFDKHAKDLGVEYRCWGC